MPLEKHSRLNSARLVSMLVQPLRIMRLPDRRVRQGSVVARAMAVVLEVVAVVATTRRGRDMYF